MNRLHEVRLSSGELVKLMKMVDGRIEWMMKNERELKIKREVIDWYIGMFEKLDRSRDRR